jgi:hypothetical protein
MTMVEKFMEIFGDHAIEQFLAIDFFLVIGFG